MSAALLEVAAERAPASWAEAPGAVAQARALHRRAHALTGEVSAAYEAARMALAGAKAGMSTPQRDFSFGRTVAAAAEPPLRLAACAADIAQLAALLAGHGPPDLRADVTLAARLAAAAAAGAADLVEINLVVGCDPEQVAAARRYATLAARAVPDG
jgi:formiminotetrahydrofolate cyclodeaminase